MKLSRPNTRALSLIQSASVFSVETKSASSDWPLPKVAPARLRVPRRTKPRRGSLSRWRRRRPQNGANKSKSSFRSAVLVRFPCGQNKDILIFFARFPSFARRTPTKSSARRPVIMPVLFSIAAHSGWGFLYTTQDPLAALTSADVSVRQARASDERQMGKLLALLWDAPNKLITNHLKFTPGIEEVAPVDDNKKARVASWTGCLDSRCPFSRLSWSVTPMFSESTKKRNSLVSPLNSLRSFRRQHVPPVGTSSCRCRTFCCGSCLFFVWTGSFCLTGIRPSPCPQARTNFPVSLCFSGPAPLIIFLSTSRVFVLISLSCRGRIALMVWMAVLKYHRRIDEKSDILCLQETHGRIEHLVNADIAVDRAVWMKFGTFTLGNVNSGGSDVLAWFRMIAPGTAVEQEARFPRRDSGEFGTLIAAARSPTCITNQNVPCKNSGGDFVLLQHCCQHTLTVWVSSLMISIICVPADGRFNSRNQTFSDGDTSCAAALLAAF